MALDIADFDITQANAEGVERVFVALNLSANTSGMRTFKRNGKEKISFRAACMPDSCIMNRIYYSPEVIADSVYSFNNVPVPYNHPEDEQGRFLSALFDPDGRVFGNLGGSYENVSRVKNSGDGNDPEEFRIWGDVVLDVATLKSTKHGKAVLAQVQRQEPIDMSVGLYLNVVQTPSDPDKDYDATWIYADHFSILPPGETPASTTEQGTGGFVKNAEMVFISNKTRDEVTLKCFVTNVFGENNPLTDAEGSDTSRNDAGSDPAPQDDEAMVRSILGWCRSRFTGGNSATATEELGDMSDENQTEVETSANAEAETSKTETVTNSGSAASAEGATTTNSAFTPEQKAEIAEIVTNAVTEVAKPLIDAQTATNADAEAKAAAHKADLVGKVVANNTLTQEIAEGTPVETLEALVANSSEASPAAVVNGTGEGAGAEKPTAASIANSLNGPAKEAA